VKDWIIFNDHKERRDDEPFPYQAFHGEEHV
jgi:hypothetical protein